MKKFIFGILLIASIFCLGYPVSCESFPKPARTDAQHVIGRTAAIISNAQQVAAQGQKCEGLGLAVSHQLLALDLYTRNSYGQAISHSLRARFLAAKVMNNLIIEALFDRVEEKYLQNMPPNKELDQKLRESKIQILSDQAALNPQLRLDVQ